MPFRTLHSAICEASFKSQGLNAVPLAFQLSEHSPPHHGAHFKADVTEMDSKQYMAHPAIGMRAWLRCGPGRKGAAAGWLEVRGFAPSSCSLTIRKCLQTLRANYLLLIGNDCKRLKFVSY